MQERSRLNHIRIIVFISALIFFLPALPAWAQDADDSFENPDPCKGDTANPIVFELFPRQAAPGGFFLISGKPHDPRTVGPGSDVSLNWLGDSSFKNYSATVGEDGKFLGVIMVPKDFQPGTHALQYAEASPYTSCLVYTVISANQAATEKPAIPGLSLLRSILSLAIRAAHWL